MRLVNDLRSHIQYKIIVPFLLLTLLVALAGSTVAFLLITGTAQDRLNNQLAEVARTASDNIVALESANLQFLREMAFAGANTQTGAPAVAAALSNGDRAGLEQALEPYYRVSTQRQGIRADRMIVFDAHGRSLLDWEHSPNGGDGQRVSRDPRDITQLWFVPRILQGSQDTLGDKYAGLLDLGDTTNYFFTVAPVKQSDRVVGGMIIATRLDTLLSDLRENSLAAIVTVYRADSGFAFASSQIPTEGLATLNIRPELVSDIRDVNVAEQKSVFNVERVNEREYQFAYAPLRIRGDVVGLISVALSTDYVTGPWSDAQIPLIMLTVVLMLAIIGLGTIVARQITQPLRELVATAQAVTAGDLDRRSQVHSQDEVGILSRSFNDMTEHLLDLYRVVQADAQQRAAIVESITDGIMVCDPHGEVIVVNRAMRTLLGLTDAQPAPRRFEELMLRPLDETVMTFGAAHTADLFNLGDKVVRVNAAPVVAEDGTRLGDVYVLQDLTREVAIDRAKTNFISTISHELRTPLTVLGGSSDLLLRGLVGPLDEDQRALIEGMRKHTQNMTTLLNNMITLAGIESGSLQFEVEALSLRHVLDEVLWSQRPAIKLKGLDLVVHVPENLPYVLADMQQLRNVLQQLIDNARRYTSEGRITITAEQQNMVVKVNVSDTGPGISDDLSAHLFTRFTRGAEGINSAERGIGLGLAISKLLIEQLGGTIWLDSTSEHGSTFSFTLPCVQEEMQSDEAFATAA
ncbi:MAG TPA: ATP-binding protein [Roseiflexaceae bacterium]|jgi:PAS domain S-box-containing protein|nr:ATP-binding protein [Roseiflexaceae bacterium]